MRHASTVLAVSLALLPVGPGCVSARQAEDGTARAAIDVGLRPTLLGGSGAALFGGSVLLGGRSGPMIGGGGWIQLGESTVETGGGDTGFRLRVAYAGLVVAWPVARRGSGVFTVRVLLGAGNGKVFLTTGGVETETGADNFGVVEPELSYHTPLAGRLYATAGVSWRAAFGVEDLTGVGDADLRAPSVRVGLAFRPGA